MTRYPSIISISLLVGFILLHLPSLLNANQPKYLFVLWHGMGDFSYSPGMSRLQGVIRETAQSRNISADCLSLRIGDTMIGEIANSYLLPIDEQIKIAQQQVAQKLQSSQYSRVIAIGLSQGSQFLRGLIQEANQQLNISTLITLGGQHMGVFGLPQCDQSNFPLGAIKEQSKDREIPFGSGDYFGFCEFVRRQIEIGAYQKDIASRIVQAMYWRDPFELETYRKHCIWLPRANNEIEHDKYELYKKNLMSLDQFIMVMFSKDTMVIPRESSWFQFYADGEDKRVLPLHESPLFTEDWLGLKEMDAQKKLTFLETDGNHLRFTDQWFVDHVLSLVW